MAAHLASGDEELGWLARSGHVPLGYLKLQRTDVDWDYVSAPEPNCNSRRIAIPRGKVLGYKMTSQCASGSGQFLENIARYLGVAVEEIGSLSQSSQNPEKCSSICAVLAETDVINMVSRGIATPDILRGIHESMAGRFSESLAAARKLEAHVAPHLTAGRSWDDAKEEFADLVIDTGLAADELVPVQIVGRKIP